MSDPRKGIQKGRYGMKCPHCGNDDESLMEKLVAFRKWFCTVCSKMFVVDWGEQ